ncbi:MAG: DUF2877 domain-containing protein [Betaproteobacteria bacterium]
MKQSLPGTATSQPASHKGRPLSINALSADVAVFRTDNAQWQGVRLHSLFERVVNLELADGRLITLAHRESDNAPDTVVVDVKQWSRMGIQMDSCILFSGGCLLLGDEVAILLDKARPWSCHLPVYAPNNSRLRANLAIANDHLEEHGRGIGIPCLTERAMSDFERELTALFRENCKGLFLAAVANDEGLARKHIDKLLGLGPGLTPAGDDFLLGFLTALNIPESPRHDWQGLGQYIIQRAIQSTNTISLAALRHAAKGQVRFRLVRLCVALLYEDRSSLVTALDHVLSIGASSGTDIALGLLSGFRLHIEN